MKKAEEITCCVVDYGTFISLAECLAETYSKVYYYSPFETEYLEVANCVKGDGLDKVERLDEPLDPDVLPEIDLFVFPDIGLSGLQRHLESMGKAVWGSRRATDLELYRTRFLKVIKEAGLPVVPSVTVRGLTALSDHLKTVNNKWVKVNRFRGNMETWHHIDYQHSVSTLSNLAVVFGGVKEHVVFVVQDPVDEDDESPVVEIGYDGWIVNGEYPASSFQGYEKKNQLYLGSLKNYADLPDEVRFVNEQMAPVLREFDYRNFWATELRVKNKRAYFIDPTARLAGQTEEQLFNTCSNLAQVIWHGANGISIVPKFVSKFSSEATIHYHLEGEGWRTLEIPERFRRAFKLYHFCVGEDGLYHFPPGRNDEIGVVCGQGDDVEMALEDLKQNFDAIKNEPVSIDFGGFVDLISEIEEAESEGLNFSDKPLPEPAEVVSK